MSGLAESMKEAAQTVAKSEAEHRTHKAATRAEAMARRPRLTAATIFQSLDWVLDHEDVLGAAVPMHLQAIELGIRVMTTEAQGKATQHTLVEDGVIAPPPAAS